MTKKIVYIFFWLSVGLFVINIQFAHNANSLSTGAPAGYTGSPGDGKTCGTNGGCHGGGAIAETGWITSNIPSGGYSPGAVYTVTATVTHPGKRKFGFEISPQSPTGSKLGSLTLLNPTETQIVNTKYITHTANGTSGNNSRSWSFDWTAPATGLGPVTFYAAFNASDSSLGTSGDTIYISELTVSEVVAGIFDSQTTEDNIILYPNPAKNKIDIVFFNKAINDICIYDVSGKKMLNIPLGSTHTSADISQLKAGTYFVKIEHTRGTSIKQFLKIE